MKYDEQGKAHAPMIAATKVPDRLTSDRAPWVPNSIVVWVATALFAAVACDAGSVPAAPPKAHPACASTIARAKASTLEGSADDAGGSASNSPRPLPKVSAPELVGVLIGPGADHPLKDLNIYGTDLGFSFEHEGKLMVMFGDTLPTPDDICNEMPNDDTIATLPGSYAGGVPELTFVTKPDSPHEFNPVKLMRGSTSLALGFGKAPMAAFSDEGRIFAFFGRLELTQCGAAGSSNAGTCPTDDEFSCSKNLGECQPTYSGVVPPLCDANKQTGCFSGQQCAHTGASFCVDPTSSQYDGSIDGKIAAVAEHTELGAQRPDKPDIFDSVLVWPTNKFINLTARPVTHFEGTRTGNDYRPGHDTLLVWGRPRFAAEGGREAQLYLMAHSLPLSFESSGALQFQPRYFAGIDPTTGEPEWSELQSRAKALALDGKVDGDPHEELHIVNQMAISWLGPPIDKWVMLYGGSLSDYLLFDPAHAKAACAPGSIAIRFAEHPWGPWSLPVPHLLPGSPSKVGDLYGPGGVLYSADCRDATTATCVRPDSLRSTKNLTPSCIAGLILWDSGRLYGPNIIEPYIAKNANDGLDLIWNVSTWNPYSVLLMKTSITAPPGSETASEPPDAAVR